MFYRNLVYGELSIQTCDFGRHKPNFVAYEPVLTAEKIDVARFSVVFLVLF